MIIKSLTLNNFRQYRGTQTIEFSTDKEKNVTIVLGVNTSGKTTIVQSFLWCLYGVCSFKTKELLNAEVKASLSANTSVTASVKIVLVHDKKEYTIERSQRYYANDFSEVRSDSPILSLTYKDDSGNSQVVPQRDHEEQINKILPKDLSDYFFFDGERIEEINDKKNVVSAVRGLMGLDIVSSAVDHLDPNKAASVVGKLKKELDVGSDQRGAILRNKQSEAEKQLSSYEARLEEVMKELSYYDSETKRLHQKLLDTAEVRGKQEVRTKLDNALRVEQSNIKSSEDRLIYDFGRDCLPFFALPLIRKAKKVLAESKKDVQGIPEMHSKSIDYILKRQRCICGCDLSKNQGAVEAIQYERSLLPPQHIGTMIRTYVETCTQMAYRSEGFSEAIERDFQEICRHKRRVDELTDDLKKVSDEIMTMGSVNARQIEDDYQSMRRLYNEKLQLKGRLESNIRSKKDELTDIQKELNGLVVRNDKNTLIKREIAYAEEVYNWFKATYDLQVAEVKEKLTLSINKIFEQMYHGQRRVEIDDNYRIRLLTSVGDARIKTDESKGLEAVKNFSFISGLVDLAREKARVADKNDEMQAMFATEPYPIVMDAPFSNVDEIHIGNISTILPNIAEQVILIVMKKDWEYAKDTMGSKVGASYYIEKVDNSDTRSIVRRAD